MLIRLIDTLLINLFNPVLRRLRQRRLARAQPPPPTGDTVLIGETLPSRPHEPIHPVTLDPDARRRHMYLLGATGTGKSNLILRLIESDLAAKRSFCVVDLRGDLVDRILLRLAASQSSTNLQDRLLLIDLRGQSQVVGFNPLAGDGDAYGRAFHVLSILRHQSDSWGIQLEETLRNCLIALAEAGKSLLEIEPLLSNAGFREQVMARVQDSYVRSFFDRYEQLSEDKKLAWSLPVLNKVTPLLAIPQLRLMFGQPQSFSFRDVLDREPGRIVLVSLAVDRLHGAAHLVGGLFISAFQNAIMARVDTPEADRVPVNLYVDEFETMASDRFEAIVAEGRRFGLGLTLSHQNLSQLPPALRDLLRNNVHTQIYFQTGAVDAAELAAEITTGEPREAVRQALIGQGVGEAFLVRRGQPSQRIKVAYAPDPRATREAVSRVCAAAHRAFGQPRGQAEEELKRREEALDALRLATAALVSPGPSKPRNTSNPRTSSKPPIPATKNGSRTKRGLVETGAGPVENAAEPQPEAAVVQSDPPLYEVRHGKVPGRFVPKGDHKAEDHKNNDHKNADREG